MEIPTPDYYNSPEISQAVETGDLWRSGNKERSRRKVFKIEFY